MCLQWRRYRFSKQLNNCVFSLFRKQTKVAKSRVAFWFYVNKKNKCSSCFSVGHKVGNKYMIDISNFVHLYLVHIIWILDRASNVKFSVECLFWFLQPTWKSDVKGVQITKNDLFRVKGGFQLLDLITPELKSYVIPYKFKCSHWWKI